MRVIAAEAHATLARAPVGGTAPPSEPWSTWIAPSPVSVRMRLFCLPYAGGVSENVFARYAHLHTLRWCCALTSTCALRLHDAERRLLAQPCDCGVISTRVFHNGRWAMMLPASIQVCPVELPGRGRRQADTPINDVAILADTLADSLPLQARRLTILSQS